MYRAGGVNRLEIFYNTRMMHATSALTLPLPWTAHVLRPLLEAHLCALPPPARWPVSILPAHGQPFVWSQAKPSDLQQTLQNQQILCLTGPPGAGKRTLRKALFASLLQDPSSQWVPLDLSLVLSQRGAAGASGLSVEDWLKTLQTTPALQGCAPASWRALLQPERLVLLAEAALLQERPGWADELNALVGAGARLILSQDATADLPTPLQERTCCRWELQALSTQELQPDLQAWPTAWQDAVNQQGAFLAGTWQAMFALQQTPDTPPPTHAAEWLALAQGQLEAWREAMAAFKQELNRYSVIAGAFDEHYVKMQIMHKEKTSAGLAHDEAKEKEIRAWPEDLLKLTEPLLLTGGPGTGKSTILRHLALELAQSARQVPIYLRLRDLEAHTEPYDKNDLLKWLQPYLSVSQQTLWQLKQAQLEPAQVAPAQTVLLLDGWDELTQNQGRLKQWAQDLCEAGYALVLSGRRAEDLTIASTRDTLPVHWTLAFDEPQQQALIQGFLPGAEHVQAREAVLQQAQQTPVLSSPLLLSMLCKTWHKKTTDLETSSAWMDHFCQYLLETWAFERDQRHAQKQWVELAKEVYQKDAVGEDLKKTLAEDFKDLLAFCAFCMQAHGAALTPEQLHTWLEHLPESRPVQNWYGGGELGNYLRKQRLQSRPSNFGQYLSWLVLSSLLVRGLQNTAFFIHQTFQEYLCAWFMQHAMSDEERDWFICTKRVNWQQPDAQRGNYLEFENADTPQAGQWVWTPPQPPGFAARWGWLEQAYTLSAEDKADIKQHPQSRFKDQPLPFDAIPEYPLMYLHETRWRQVLVYLIEMQKGLSARIEAGEMNQAVPLLQNPYVDAELAQLE